MKSHEIRQSFIDFFAEREHRITPSGPLVPHGDATLLFTNAGMVPFKDFFLGADTPPSPRAVSSQKCLRVSGKHNDLENVGPSPRHHTFFEMLGNFSFGDYFKEEAIQFGWDLVTKVWGLPPEHLTATVFEDDDEAAELWAKISGLPPDRIKRCGAKDNFWAMGDTGPCGPCSEIFVDRHPELPPEPWEEGSENGRYLEIWNLVFMQFERTADGELHELPNPSIDTGAGLERVSAVLQGVESNYDTDLFQPILGAAAKLAGIRYGDDDAKDTSLRVIADHLRALTFLLADGVIPSNEGRGYVLRRILRRAVRHGMRLGFEEPFLHTLMPVVEEVMGQHYRDLAAASSASRETLRVEEEKFLSTVATASVQVQSAIDQARARGEATIDGESIFRFYDTYGLPVDLIREIAEEEQFELDLEGFERELEHQRSRSRAASADSRGRLAEAKELIRGDARLAATNFVGYTELSVEETRVQWLATDAGQALGVVDEIASGEGVITLESTPFYAESGGQVGDTGRLTWTGGEALILDTQKNAAGVYFHFVEVVSGSLSVGATVRAEVDRERRQAIERHHTATHLLHAALRTVLGSGVRQAGSLVAPDRLRFDFTYGQPMTVEEIERVETIVNRWVLGSLPTTITENRPYDEALSAGATALFGEKYGDHVRTVEIPELAGADEGRTGPNSFELCGGCHVARTSEIGLAVITSERGVASGVRRIEALTGEAARDLVRQQRELVRRAADVAQVEPERLPEEIAELRQQIKGFERELGDLRMKLVSGAAEEGAPTEVDGVAVVSREVPPAPRNEIRNMADVLLSKAGGGVVVLGTREGEKVTLVAAVSKELVGRLHAGNLLKEVAVFVDGNGGGRPDFAQAGGKSPEKLPAALSAVTELVRHQLEGTVVG